MSIRPGGIVVDLIVYSDICIYREGLRVALERQNPLRSVSICGSLQEVNYALRDVQEEKPVIAVVDLASKNALPLIDGGMLSRHILVVLTLRNDPETMTACVRGGARGFLTRRDTSSDLEECITTVSAGSRYYSPSAASILVDCASASHDSVADRSTLDSLTPRQQEILSLIERGYSNKRIAATMMRSEATIKNHVHNILQRLNVHTRGQAAAKYRRVYPTHY